jgi:hypothetical protein
MLRKLQQQVAVKGAERLKVIVAYYLQRLNDGDTGT